MRTQNTKQLTGYAEYVKDFAEIFQLAPDRIIAINVYQRDAGTTMLYSFHTDHETAETELDRIAHDFTRGVTFARGLPGFAGWIVADAFDSEEG